MATEAIEIPTSRSMILEYINNERIMISRLDKQTQFFDQGMFCMVTDVLSNYPICMACYKAYITGAADT